MITFYQLGQLGRLGNQLFQYAALRGLSLERGYTAKIPHPDTRSWHGQSCLLESFNIEAEYYQEPELLTIKQAYNEPDYMKYDSRFYQIPDNTNLTGFFQSTFYFQGHEDQIKKELTPHADLMKSASATMAKIKRDHPGYKIVSLHLRRGDNTDNTDSGQVELNNSYGGEDLTEDSFYYQYYKKATDIFKEERVKYLIFSGGKRESDDNSEDMEWCKRNFVGDNFLFSEGKSTMEDFCLIISCDYNIISHVSSFGWWAAYLNPSEDKKVVAPLQYHPDRLDINYREGFYPEEWILV